MEMAKTVKKYGTIYRKILLIGNYSDLDAKQKAYEKRLIEMYTSKNMQNITYIQQQIWSISMQSLPCVSN
jgi:hypothetical protein